VAIFDNDGNYDGAIEVIHDGTDKRKAFEKLIQQKKELEEKQLELDDKIDELTATAEVVESMNIDLQEQHHEIELKNEILTQQKNEILEKHEELVQQKEEIMAINEVLEIQKAEISIKNEVLEAQKLELIEQHQITQRQSNNIKNSIEYARRIQFAALKMTKEIPFREHFIIFRPKDIVSGDFYMVKKFFNYTIIVVADCTGHGVPGAFLSLLGISLLNDLTSKHFRKISKTEVIASKLLDDLRDNIIKTLHQNDDKDSTKDGMDMALCIYDEETKELQFSGAYNPMILIRDNKLEEIKGDNMPIGIHFFKDMSMKTFTNHNFKLKEGDCIYLCSDGYQDQYGELTDRKFLRRNFYDLLHQIHKKQMDEQKEMLEQIITDFQGNCDQTDDILVVGLKV
jgi:serine phosphatase RsbU (regulator of sigma subunit)